MVSLSVVEMNFLMLKATVLPVKSQKWTTHHYNEIQHLCGQSVQLMRKNICDQQKEKPPQFISGLKPAST